MKTEKYLANKLASRLPSFINDLYPKFGKFLFDYYTWFERDGSSYNFISDFTKFHDIDETDAEFVDYFARTFIEDFPETVIDKRTLIKHIREFYTSRGTENSIQFLFKILFDQEVDLYYPYYDILIPSDGKWQSDLYIKTSAGESVPINMAGSIITGQTSGAIAIIDSITLSVSSDDNAYMLIKLLDFDSVNPASKFTPGEVVISESWDSETVLTETIYNIVVGAELTNDGENYQENDPITIFLEETSNQLIDNGRFYEVGSWIRGIGWTVSNNIATCTGLQTADTVLYHEFDSTLISTGTDDKWFYLSFDLTVTAGDVDISVGTTSIATTFDTDGTHTLMLQRDSADVSDLGLYITGNSDFVGTVDNVFCIEVTENTLLTDSRFTYDIGEWDATGLAINHSLISGPTTGTIINIDAGAGVLSQDISDITTPGEFYEASFTITNYGAGTLRINVGGTVGETVSATGSYTEVIQCGSTGIFSIEIDTGTLVQVEDISLVNYNDDKIDKTDYDQALNWVWTGGWDVTTDGLMEIISPEASTLYQEDVMVHGESYRVTIDILAMTAGTLNLQAGDLGDLSETIVAAGTYIYYMTALTSDGLVGDFNVVTSSTFVGEINLISAEQVDNLVLGGTFDEDVHWDYDDEFTISAGDCVHTDLTASPEITQTVAITPGTLYILGARVTNFSATYPTDHASFFVDGAVITTPDIDSSGQHSYTFRAENNTCTVGIKSYSTNTQALTIEEITLYPVTDDIVNGSLPFEYQDSNQVDSINLTNLIASDSLTGLQYALGFYYSVYNGESIYSFDGADGTYTGNFSLVAQSDGSYYTDITFDGTHFYISTSSGIIEKYDTLWARVGYFDTTPVSFIKSINYVRPGVFDVYKTNVATDPANSRYVYQYSLSTINSTESHDSFYDMDLPYDEFSGFPSRRISLLTDGGQLLIYAETDTGQIIFSRYNDGTKIDNPDLDFITVNDNALLSGNHTGATWDKGRAAIAILDDLAKSIVFVDNVSGWSESSDDHTSNSGGVAYITPGDNQYLMNLNGYAGQGVISQKLDVTENVVYTIHMECKDDVSPFVESISEVKISIGTDPTDSSIYSKAAVAAGDIIDFTFRAPAGAVYLNIKNSSFTLGDHSLWDEIRLTETHHLTANPFFEYTVTSTNWIAVDCTTSVTDGVLTITSTATDGYVYQDIPTTIGNTYRVRSNGRPGATAAEIRFDTTNFWYTDDTHEDLTYTASGTTTRIQASCLGASGNEAEFDYIIVEEVVDDYDVWIYDDEEILNPSFEGYLSDWTAVDVALTTSNNKLDVRNLASASSGYGYQYFDTTIGEMYSVAFTVDRGTADALIRIGTTAGGSEYNEVVVSADGEHSYQFRATATTAYVSLGLNDNTTSNQCKFDNIYFHLTPIRTENSTLVNVYGWLKTTSVAIASGTATWTNPAQNQYMRQNGVFETGKTYRVTVSEVSSSGDGWLTIEAVYNAGATRRTLGWIADTFVPRPGVTQEFTFTSAADGDFRIITNDSYSAYVGVISYADVTELDNDGNELRILNETLSNPYFGGYYTGWTTIASGVYVGCLEGVGDAIRLYHTSSHFEIPIAEYLPITVSPGQRYKLSGTISAETVSARLLLYDKTTETDLSHGTLVHSFDDVIDTNMDYIVPEEMTTIYIRMHMLGSSAFCYADFSNITFEKWNSIIENGLFHVTDGSWDVESNWDFAHNRLVSDGDSGIAFQNASTFKTGWTYKITIIVDSISTGTVQLRAENIYSPYDALWSSALITTAGTYSSEVLIDRSNVRIAIESVLSDCEIYSVQIEEYLDSEGNIVNEVLDNPGFDGSSDVWTITNSAWDITPVYGETSQGLASSQGVSGDISQTQTGLIPGRDYTILANVSEYTSGSIILFSDSEESDSISSTGQCSLLFTASATEHEIGLRSTLFDGRVEYMSMTIIEEIESHGVDAVGYVNNTSKGYLSEITVEDGGTGYLITDQVHITSEERAIDAHAYISAMDGVDDTKIATVTLIDPGLDYPTLPRVSVESDTGSGAILIPESDTIGNIVNVKMYDSGTDYIPDPVIIDYPDVAENSIVIFPVTVHYKDDNGSFVEGDIVSNVGSTATGRVARVTDYSRVLCITPYIGDFAVDDIITGSISQVTATIHSLSQAEGLALIDGVAQEEGRFTNTDGHLSSDKYIQDSYYYQKYSYVISSFQPKEDWIDVIENTVHPAGTIVFNYGDGPTDKVVIINAEYGGYISPSLESVGINKFRDMSGQYAETPISQYDDLTIDEMEDAEYNSSTYCSGSYIVIV